jgi:putative ABC transport system permease protein
MIRHLLKLVWNRKRINAILMTEIIFSFVVMFVIFSIGTNYLWIYLKNSGFDSQNVYVLKAVWWNVNNVADSTVAKDLANYQNIFASFPEITKISYCGNNVAYSSSTWTGEYQYDQQKYQCNHFVVDSNFFSVMKMPIVSGQDFSGKRSTKYHKYVVINEKFKEELESNGSCIGKKLVNDGNYTYTIVGTIGNYKYYNEFTDATNQVFLLNNLFDTTSLTYPEIA